MKKILIVEDDRAMRDALSDRLSRTYEIAQAEDGEEGYKFILTFKPDLVLLDLLLPKLPGIELLEKLRKHPDLAIANTGVIIFSNFSSEEYFQKAKQFNAQYLVKALTDLPDLVKKIEKTLNDSPT